MSVKVVSINIEGKKHLESVAKFLDKQDADIVCMMEAPKSEILNLAGERYPYVVFAPNDVLGNIEQNQTLEPTGVAIMSKTVMLDVEKDYFGTDPRGVVVERGSGSHAPVLLMATIGELKIGATHFTWTKKGSVSKDQEMHLDMLLNKIKDQEIVICGDFNIPRGNEMYLKIAKQLKDNIPSEVESTLDPVLHYANEEVHGKLKLVVDYVWSTKRYSVNDVKVISGVSDHCALVCTISLV